MNSDIRLAPDRVTVQAWDLELVHPERRSEPTTPFRRALVHDDRDGLTINFASDYPGGVRIGGRVHIVASTAVPMPGLGVEGTAPTVARESIDILEEFRLLRSEMVVLRARLHALENKG